MAIGLAGPNEIQSPDPGVKRSACVASAGYVGWFGQCNMKIASKRPNMCSFLHPPSYLMVHGVGTLYFREKEELYRKQLRT